MAERLEVVITGDAESAKREISEVRGSLQRLGDTAKGALGVALKTAALGAAAGIGSLTAAMAGAVKSTVAWAEKLDSVSDVLGTTAEESAALTVAVEGVGIPVEDVTTALARLANGLANTKGEAGPVTDALERLGVKIRGTNGNMLPTVAILEQVANKLADMPDGLEKTNLMMDLFGRSGANLSDAMTALAHGGLEKAREKAEKLGLVLHSDDVDGAIAFGRALETLKMALRGVAVQIGVHLLPVAQRLVDWIQTHLPDITVTVLLVANAIREKVAEVRDRINKVIADVGAFIGRLKVQLAPAEGVVAGFLKPFREIADNVQTALTFAAGTVKLLAGDIGDILKEKGIDIQSTFGGVWETVANLAVGRLKTISDVVAGAMLGIRTVVWQRGDEIKSIIGTVIDVAGGIGSVFATAAEVIGPKLEELGAALAPIGEGIVGALFSEESVSNVQNWLNQILDIVRGIVGPLTVIVSDLVGNITTFIQTHGDEIVGAFQHAWESVQGIISGVLEIIKLTIVPVLQEIMAIIRRHGDEIQAVINAVWTIVSNIIQGALDLIRGIINTVVAILKGDWEGAWESIKSTVEGTWERIKTIVEGAINGVAAILSAVWSEIDEEVISVWNGIKSFIEGVWEGIKNSIKNAINSIIDFINGLIRGYNEVAGTLGLGQIGLIPRLAHGAINFPGGLALVGERGPELVVLPRGASVIPLTASPATNISNTFNLTVYGGGRTESIISDYHLMRAWAARS